MFGPAALEFNVAGPCNPREHYMIPPERRLGDVIDMVRTRKYFTLTGSWQTGKTTCAKWLETNLNARGEWRALWVDVETAREQPDLVKGFRTIVGKLVEVCALCHPDVPLPEFDKLMLDLARALSKCAIASRAAK